MATHLFQHQLVQQGRIPSENISTFMESPPGKETSFIRSLTPLSSTLSAGFLNPALFLKKNRIQESGGSFSKGG